MKVKDALKTLSEEEAKKLINEDELRSDAIELVEQTGIVFIDELDKKIAKNASHSGGEISREGFRERFASLIEEPTFQRNLDLSRLTTSCLLAQGPSIYQNPQI